MTTFTSTLNQVESMYVGYFGRAGDPAGTNYWVGLLNAKTITLATLAASFSIQPEATSKYPYLANPNINDPGIFVDQVYQNMFNHVADAAGKAYWVAQLTAAAGNPAAIGAMIQNIIAGAIGADSTTIINKVDVAADFTTKAANAGTTWSESANAQSSAEIATVTDTAASVTAAKAATDVFIATAPGPQDNFTLGIDTLSQSAFNANFNASLIFNPPSGTLIQSLQTGDSAIDTAPLTGPGLSNGGTFTVALNAGAVPLVTLKGIPTHTVTALAGSGYSGDITGLVTLNNNSSAGGVTIGLGAGGGIDKGGIAGTTTTGATLLSTVNINNSAGGGTTVNVNTAALAGAADALKINVVGVLGTGTGAGTSNTVSVKNDTVTGAGGVAQNGYETIALTAAAATNISLGDAASGVASTTGITLAGAGLVTLWGSAATTEAHFTKVTTIDASTQTGGVTVTGASNTTAFTGFLTGNTVISSFKGGTGADSVDLSSLSAAQAQAITATNLDGGTGTARDTYILAAAAAQTTVAINATNFEIAGVAAATTGTYDISKLGTGVDTLALSSAATAAAVLTITNPAAGFTFAAGNNINTALLAVTGGAGVADAFNVTGHTGAGVATTYGAQTFTGVETLTETFSVGPGATGATAPVTIASITAAATAGAVPTLNLVDNIGASTLTVGTIGVGLGGIVVSGTGTLGVTIGAVTAAALNASGLNTGAAAATVGLTQTAFATAAITVTGSNGADQLAGSAFADTLSGGTGDDRLIGGTLADVITTGTGTDTLGIGSNFGLVGQSIVASAGPAAAIAAGNTFTFATTTVGNVDRVVDFISGTDKMDVATAATAPTTLIGVDAATTALTAGVTYVAYGNYLAATGVFTVAGGWSAGTADAIVVQGDGALFANTTTGFVVVTGLNQALVAADFT